MVRTTLIMAVVIGTAWYCEGMAACPFSDDQGQVNSTDLKNARQASLDEPCLMLLIERMKKGSDKRLVEQLTALVEAWSKSNGFSLSLLSKCAELQNLNGDAETGKRIIALWESRNKPFAAAVSELTVTGSQERADSLFVAYDRCIALGADALLWWARIKEIRNAPRGAVGLYCRAMALEPRIRSMVFSQVSQFIENVSTDSVRSVLGQLERCIFSLPGTDTLRMQLWFADAYARHDCSSEETDVLGRFPPFSPGIATRLLDVARKRFREADYPHAIRAARLVVKQVQEVQKTQIAAMVLSHSYDALGMADSALYWLERGDLSSGPGKIEAASLYQRHGRPVDARRMLDALKPSFSRDTLEIRQRLYAGDRKAARDLFVDRSTHWTGNSRETLLWNVRTLLFLERFDELSACLDTLRIDPSWDNSRELIDYRYYWNLFSREGDALSVWAGVEYNLFIGNMVQASELIASQRLPDDLASALLLRVLRELKNRGNLELIVKTVEDTLVQSSAPECTYLYAEALFGLGKPARARSLLLQLLQDFPADVFSQKARILLARISR